MASPASPLPAIVRPATPKVIEAVASKGTAIEQRAAALEIVDEESMKAASTLLQDIKALQDEVDEDLGEPKKQAHALHRQLSETYNKHARPLERLVSVVKGKIAEYVEREQERRRIAAAQEAERQRKADEEARLAEAAALEAAGEREDAEAVLNEEPPPPPPPRVERPKVAGISTQVRWSAEVVDMTKLVVAAASGDSTALGILTDEKVVAVASSRASAVARALKANLKVPGVKVHRETGVARR